MSAGLRSRGGAAFALVVAATALAVVAGALGWRWVTLAAILVAALGEPYVKGAGDYFDELLGEASLARPGRILLRLFAVLAAVAAGAGSWTDPALRPALVWTAALFVAAHALLVLLVRFVDHARTPIVLLRNVDVPVPVLRPAPPPGLRPGRVPWLGVLELGVALPALLAPTVPALLWVVGGLVVAVLVVLDGWLALAARAAGGSLRGPAFRRKVQRWLDRAAPEVLVYFGGRKESAYQLHVWLTTLERLPQRPVVLLRDPKVFSGLPATSLPVLCVPGSVDLMSLDLSSAHVALFIANVGNSLHVLRLPHLMTTFIGHGDSDKSASSSPFAKVYDEIWVAGPAGRERYRRAEVGVRDEDVVEVGRPQLDSLVLTRTRSRSGPPTLLYAPTWEGWNAEQHYTSLDSLGPEIVAAALAVPGRVRVIYKPHPFTGRRDPRIARSHARIVAMLRAANTGAGLRAPGATVAVGAGPEVVSDGLRGAFAHCERSALETEALRAAAEERFWAGVDPSAHLVVEADGPSLFSCFDQADALVTDVSSVLTDFTATGRPYAVTNPTAAPYEQFTSMFPAAAAGFVIDSGPGIERLIAVLTGEAPDEHALARERVRTDLLGDTAVPATERFAAAVAALAERGRAREASHQQRGSLAVGDFAGGIEGDD